MGGFSASAMNTAAARARSSQSRPGSAYSRACPNADTENRSPRSVTFGMSSAAALRLAAHRRPERHRRPPRRWDTSRDVDGQARRRRGDQPRAGARSCPTDFRPTAIEPGRIVSVVCRPAPSTVCCWPPASRSAPRRAVATSTSASSGAVRHGGTAATAAPAGILWQALFETGDLSEWTGDGNGGIYMDPRATAPAATANNSHRGLYSGIATFAPMGADVVELSAIAINRALPRRITAPGSSFPRRRRSIPG